MFSVWIGVNDYWDAKDDPVRSIENIRWGLDNLVAKGAVHLMVFNNFDLPLSLGYGLRTEYHELIPTVRKLTRTFNTGLHQMLFDASEVFVHKHSEVTGYFVGIDVFMATYVKNTT